MTICPQCGLTNGSHSSSCSTKYDEQGGGFGWMVHGLEKNNHRLKEIIKYMWENSELPKCGYDKMTKDQKDYLDWVVK